MDSQKMTRRDFITLTLTLVGGGAAVAAGCSSSMSNASGGTGGSGSGGAGGGMAAGGHTGTGGAAAGGHTGADASTDVHADATADTANSCADPLPSTQVADATGHTHDLIILAATLSETTTQTLQTGGYPPGSGAHYHTIMLSPTDLATLRGGGMVTVTSTLDGDPAHSHMFGVSCH
jgi:hypothetical protein